MPRIIPEPKGPPRSLDVVTKVIEVYPPSWRKWCEGPFRGGCACMGCIHWPAPSTVQGDPEGQPFPNSEDRLSKEEVEMYLTSKADK